jgi:DNA (cytosine-5)-methyltransferase 1|tara:strand:- start:8009 stop:9052 length:1044 start_codon:yes stop_codon:yes gene_type:complete
MSFEYGYVPSMQEINNIEKEYKVISTFSGVGGSSLGYKMAGLNVIAAVEFLDYQAKTYRANHINTKLYEGNIRDINPLEMLTELGLKSGELDILDGSPPCSAFSTAGKREAGWGKAKKYGNRVQVVDDLFFEYIRFVQKMQPKVFVAENVSGLIKGSAKGYFKEIFNLLITCGYNVKAKVINAKYYGVPQSRERLIFIGVRKDLNILPSYPMASNNVITLNKAFHNIVNTKKDLMQSDIRKYAIYKEALKITKKSNKYMSLVKQSPNKPSDCLTATAGNLGAASVIHWDNRKFTVPECKSIGSFPSDFELVGSWGENTEAIGRAVPPLMMCAIAKNIKENILNKIKN